MVSVMKFCKKRLVKLLSDKRDTGLEAMDLEHLKKFKHQILELAKANKALNIRVFGSVSRKQAQDDSDIDFLVVILM